MPARIKRIIKTLVPKPLLDRLLPAYHLSLAWFGSVLYRSPSRELTVIAVTGTKGKTSVTELIGSILSSAGHTVAVLNTIHFTIGDAEEQNLFKMTMPGRFFIQRFLRRAVNAGCTHAVIEMTSEGAKQHRHRFIALDALVFTNLAPEHIESHGSFEAYRAAKLKLRDAVANSPKARTILIANADDPSGALFLDAPVTEKVAYSLHDVSDLHADDTGISMYWRGVTLTSALPGKFNAVNILAAAEAARAFGAPDAAIQEGIARVTKILGRAESIDLGQGFPVIVDYAHTPESLTALYETYKNRPLICVLGATGGGRDTGKRKRMGEIADSYCNTVILTNEDPYDEDPAAIVEAVAAGMKRPPTIVMDRREAIQKAIASASAEHAVLITGKGTDPYIMGPNGTKTPWSDATVAREALESYTKSASKERGAVPGDVLFVVGILVFIIIAWFVTGGPAKSSNGSLFVAPVIPQVNILSGEGVGGGTQDVSGRDRDFELIRSELGELYDNELELSPHRNKVSIVKRTSGPRASSPSLEYVELSVHSSVKEPIDITGWYLESLVTNKKRTLPKAVSIPSAGVHSVEQNVIVSGGEIVLIASGRSPVGTSFRTNKCTGYFEQFQDFTPELTRSCPLPEDEAVARGYTVRDLGANCLVDFVERMPRCQMRTDAIPARYTSACHRFIGTELNYNGCVELHRNDADFYADEWRLYLRMDEELWLERYEIIRLADREGRTVDIFTY